MDIVNAFQNGSYQLFLLAPLIRMFLSSGWIPFVCCKTLQLSHLYIYCAWSSESRVQGCMLSVWDGDWVNRVRNAVPPHLHSFHIHIVRGWDGGRQLVKQRGGEGRDIWRRRTAVLHCQRDRRKMRRKPSCRLQQAKVWYILHASDIAYINTCSTLLKRNKTLKSYSDDEEDYALESLSRGSIWEQMMSKHVAEWAEESACGGTSLGHRLTLWHDEMMRLSTKYSGNHL